MLVSLTAICVLFAVLACRSAALGAVFASAFVLHFGSAPQHPPGAAPAFTALLLLFSYLVAGRQSCKLNRLPRLSRLWAASALPLAIVGWLVGMPHAIGPWLLACAAVVLHLAKAEAVVRRLGAAAGLGGLLLSSQSFVGSGFPLAYPEHVPDTVGRVTAMLLRVAGADAAFDGNAILAWGASEVWSFPVSYGILAAKLVVSLTVGMLVILELDPPKSARYRRSSAMSLASGYVFARLATLILLYVYLDALTGGGGATRNALFDHPACIALSMLPLMWIWSLLLPSGGSAEMAQKNRAPEGAFQCSE
jgi:hypothetical protein